MIDLPVAGALLLSIALLCVRQIGPAIPICAAQAVLAAFVLGQKQAVAALLFVALNGIAMPVAMVGSVGKGPLRHRGSPILAWGAVIAMSVAALAVFGTPGAERLAAGAAVVLLGLLVLGLRTHALAPALGLLSSQNGLVLVAGARAELAPLAAFAVAAPLAPALALAGSWLRR